MAEKSYWNSCYMSSISEESLNDVKWYINTYKAYMYTRLLQMFTYKNLPETIPQEMLEYYLLSGGCCFVTKVDDKLYAFQGSVGGVPDPYYRPTLFVVANPALGISESFNIKEDGVLVVNDRLWYGLDALVSRYAYLMATNVITIKTVDVVLRCIALLTAPDDKSKKSAEEYLNQLEAGRLGVIGENPFFEGIKMQSPPANNGSYLTQFIELHQYYKGSFYNEIGLNANFNMKREAIGKGEASLSQDSLLPLCDTMLECRRECVKKINEMFGTNIIVEFASAWRDNHIESELELRKLENESSQLEGGDESLGGEAEVDSGDFRDNDEYSRIGDSGEKEDGGETEEKTEEAADVDREGRTDEEDGEPEISDEEEITASGEDSQENNQEVDIVININDKEVKDVTEEDEESIDE